MIRSSARPLVASALALTLLLGGCTSASPTPAPKPVGQASAAASVQVAAVERGALASAASYSGSVQARQQVSLIPKVAGRATKVAVDVGSSVKAGDVLLEIEPDALAIQLAQAEAGLAAAQARLSGMEAGPRAEQVTQAEANLEIAKLRLATLEKGGRDEQVAQAEANLASAQARLDQLKKGPTPQELQQGQLAVDQAKNALWGAQTSRDGICGNSWAPKFQCDSANAQVATAETAVAQAQSRLDQLKAGPTAEQVTQAEAAVTAADGQLKLARRPASAEDLQQSQDAVRVAEAQLALARQPVTEYDVQGAKAAVAQAKAAVDLAKLQLAESTVKAPFAGVVSQRLVSVGAMAGPTAPVLVLLSTDAEVVINVDERALATLKPGQTAAVNASAYPDQEFSATVTVVAPAVDPKSRTAQVRLSPNDAEGKLRDGMFAQVKLSADAARRDSLLVPKAAVTQEERETVAYVVAEGKVKRQVVTTGLADGERIEIVAGLAEGQKVAVSGLAGLRDGAAVTAQ